jgi:membrane protein implicated in regulation of membrane protease activity
MSKAATQHFQHSTTMSYRPLPPQETLDTSVFISDDNVNDMKTVDLHEPLLNYNERLVDMEYGNAVTFYNTKILRTAKTIKAFALIAGSVVALFSQLVLYLTLWNDDVLSRPTSSVIMFSLAWSFWTCLIVFSLMSFVARSCSYPVNEAKKKTSDEEQQDEYEDNVFQIEAHYIVGALLSISMTWLINDLFQAKSRVAERAIQIHPVLTVVSAAVAYALFVRWIVVRRNSMDTFEDEGIDCESRSYQSRKLDSLAPTFQMVSATLGTIVGLCSQFILSMILWRENMTKPAVESVVCFSLIWSFVTVVITLTGCFSLRFMLASSTTMRNEIMSTLEQLQLNRVALRMEAAYVSSSLIGICSAWIIIDVLTNMIDQILPNVFMLLISLAAFRAIIFCIPEDQCMYQVESTSVEVA